MRFAKYHGLGNDFVVVDLRTASPEEAATVQDPAVVEALCDRQFGVGGDGVLAVLPGDPGADARMRVLNADGSTAEMCGNGIRCVAKELYDRGGVKKDKIVIDTGAGRLICAISATASRAKEITVTMGAPRLTRSEIPMTGPAHERCIEQQISVAGCELMLTAVSMGNPHAVAFFTEVDNAQLHALARSVGPSVETHGWFPRKTNAEFARVLSPREIDLVVWERGVGITLACGTGACGTTVAAILTGRAEAGSEVRVHVPGGDLVITVEKDLSNVYMRGPAEHVFDGELDPRAVVPRPR